MKKTLILCMSCFLFCFSIVFAQEVKERPLKYINPVEGVFPLPNDPPTGIPWFVYSDRANNPIYDSETGTNPVATAGFMEEFAVIDIKCNGKRLPIAKRIDIQNNKLMQGRTIIGWMDADNLLLWKNSIADKKHQIDKKAMIFFTLNTKTKLTQNAKTNFKTVVPILDGPGSHGSKTLDEYEGLFQFLHVYKESGDYLLLGKSFSLNDGAEYCDIKGWVKKDKLSQWSHRVAWEKNWDPAAVAERMKNLSVDGVKTGVMVLGDENDAKSYARIDRKKNQFIPATRTAYEEVKIESVRRAGPMDRFPILDIDQIRDNQSNITGRPIKTGVIGDVKDFKGNTIDLQKIYDAYVKRDKLKNINILLVVDATQSIIDYRESIKTGIKNALQAIQKMYKESGNLQDSTIGFKFGCILYRDWAMKDSIQKFGKAGQGFSDNTKELFDWLDVNLTLDKNKYRSGVTTDDMEEAVFFGMSQAMFLYDLNPLESNYMLLIGDCGDHQDRKNRSSMFVSMDSVLHDLKENRVNLMAFQAHNSTHSSYNLFQSQMKQILEKHSDTNLVNSKKNYYELPKGAKYSGKLIVPEKNNSIDPVKMAGEVTETIKQISEDVNSRVRFITKMLSGYGDNDKLASSANDIAKTTEDLFAMGFTPKEIEVILNGMSQEYREGYTVIQCEGYQYPNYKPVVLFEAKELDQIITAFKDFVIAKKYPSSIKRGRLESALKEWFPIYFSGLPEDKIKTQNVGQLLEQITGLKFGTLYQAITIEDVTNIKKVDTKSIDDFLNDIEKILKNLEVIYRRRINYEALIINDEVDDIFLYIPGEVFINN
jgi:hypothetical protein